MVDALIPLVEPGIDLFNPGTFQQVGAPQLATLRDYDASGNVIRTVPGIVSWNLVLNDVSPMISAFIAIEEVGLGLYLHMFKIGDPLRPFISFGFLISPFRRGTASDLISIRRSEEAT